MVSALGADLGQWGLDERGVRERLYGAPTARERERWHALWLLDQGWPAARVATALERDAHTRPRGTRGWLEGFRQSGPDGLIFEQTGGPPPPSTRASRGR